ncbi:MAG TPA: MFS transporter, partial [Fimbriimonas sp.]|nr:MFS transporter [Fimbriimonas sp.]
MRPRSTELALLLAVFLDMVGFTMLIPNIQLRAETLLQGSPLVGPTIGLLLQSTFIVQLFASPRWGKWADATGRKKVFILCQWLSALAMLIYGFADVVWLLFVSRIIAGFGGANVSVAQAMAAAHAGDARKKQVMGWMSGILSAGMIFGPGLGGLVGHQFGAAGLGITGALISFIGGIVVMVFVPNDEHREVAAEPTKPDRKWF